MRDALRRVRLLVVEDDELARDVMLAHLGADAEVVFAASAIEAIACMRAMPFDAVIASEDLDELQHGVPLLAEVEQAWPHLPRYVMGDVESDPFGMALVKPVLRVELLAIVASCAERLGLHAPASPPRLSASA